MKYGCRLPRTLVKKVHTENNERLLKALSLLEECSQFQRQLLTEVVYGVTTELRPNSDFTENMHIFTKYTSLVFAHIILYMGCAKRLTN